MKKIAFTFSALAVAACIALPVSAQPAAAVPAGPGVSMLVLDASGSMWGQIQGRSKIEIAREAVGTMLKTWPRKQQIGLMAYGHRSKGDCADIEMLKAPGVMSRLRGASNSPNSSATRARCTCNAASNPCQSS